MAEHQLTVLIVEDDPIDGAFFENVVKKAGGIPVLVQEAEAAVSLLAEEEFGLVLTDLVLDGMSGMDLLRLVKRYHQGVEVVIITAYASVENAVEAMKWGAFSYFVKGEPAKKLVGEIEKIALLDKSRKELFESSLTPIESIALTSRNQAFNDVLALAQNVAPLDRNVLLVGRPDLCAQAIAKCMHLMSNYSDKGFKVLSNNDIEQLVREHGKAQESGATGFTWRGASEVGTYFVEDVDRISEDVFSAFLSLIDRSDNVVGDYRLSRARVIAGSFGAAQRQCNGGGGNSSHFPLILKIPSLHERPEDLPDMVRSLLPSVNEELGTSFEGVSKDLCDHLLTLAYRENIVSLLGVLRAVAVVAENDVLDLADFDNAEVSGDVLPKDALVLPGDPDSLRDARDQAEMEHIHKVLARAGGNKTQAAKALGITSRQLYNKLLQYKLD